MKLILRPFRIFAGFELQSMHRSDKGPKIVPPLLWALLLAQEMGGEALPNSGFRIQDSGLQGFRDFRIQDFRT